MKRELSDAANRYDAFWPKGGLLRDLSVFVIALGGGAAIAAGAIRLIQSPFRGLPYHDEFATSDASEWSAYDGNWNVHAGVMTNESNERGAKLISGSQYWTDYSLDADIALNNTGDAGILVRVADAESGVDAYSGLYGGLRFRDEALVLGKADHGWEETASKPLPETILPNTWYHLHMEVRGCHVSLSANREYDNAKTEIDVTVPQCPKRGRIGLRSYDSGGQWKNIRVSALR